MSASLPGSVTARCWAVVPAAGIGARVGAGTPKQYLSLAGRTVLEHSIAPLLDCADIGRVVVAVAAGDGWWPQLPVACHPRIASVVGGAERCHSVLAGLDALAGEAAGEDWVLVHDAARPCLPPEDLQRLLDTLREQPVGGLLAVPVADTLKRVEGGQVLGTVDRSALWRALTPQMFRFGLLRAALRRALEEGRLVTDEAHAVELAGHLPQVVEGSARNIKITRPEDVALAAFYLTQGAT